MIGLLVFSPFFLIISFILFFSNGRPVFFKQARIGKNGNQFYFYKFRTMTSQKDSNGALLSDEKRITKIGKWIRKTSLDEIPSLFNVVKGEMNLVGPRPLLPEYLPLYSKEQNKRHLVSPGITGWAQINGRNAITWEKKFKLDVWYVKNRNLILDLKILFLTIYKVIKAENISPDGQEIMPKFKGSKKS